MRWVFKALGMCLVWTACAHTQPSTATPKAESSAASETAKLSRAEVDTEAAVPPPADTADVLDSESTPGSANTGEPVAPMVGHSAPSVLWVTTDASELLGSEKRALRQLRGQLTPRWTVIEGRPDDAVYLQTPLPSPVPAHWRSVDLVVLLSVRPPLGQAPRRRSQGLGQVIVLRPPDPTPVYKEVASGALAPAMAQYWSGNIEQHTWLPQLLDALVGEP